MVELALMVRTNLPAIVPMVSLVKDARRILTTAKTLPVEMVGCVLMELTNSHVIA